LWAGAAAWAAGGAAELLGAPVPLPSALLAGGSVAIGLVLLSVSRSSIAARVAASGATTILLVILVLAIALSQVISSSLQHSELQRLGSRAHAEAVLVGDVVAAQVRDSRFVAADLAASDPGAVVALGTGASGAAQASGAIRARLATLESLYRQGGLAYIAPTASAVIATAGVSPALVEPFSCGPATGSAAPGCTAVRQGLVAVAGGQAWAVAAYPERLTGSGRLLGTVVAVDQLDSAYLRQRTLADPSVSLALVTASTVVASSASGPPARALLAAVASEGQAHQVGDLSVSGVALSRAGTAVPLSLVLYTTGTTLTSTSAQLYRTLFLIALGATLLALGLAAFTGDRITAGVRRLTQVASRIQGGERSERAEIAGEDEVAVLGSAFDSMIDSVEEQASALRSAADDETRLRNRLEAVLAGMTDALVAVDASGTVTEVNRAAEELTGTGRTSALGLPLGEVVNLVPAGAGMPPGGFPEPGSNWSGVGSLRCRDGSEVPVAVSSGPLLGPAGERSGTVLVLRDLRAERQVERMKDEILSRVGHELRTPLTGIIGYADILRRTTVPAERARSW
ncbi:MAG: PAS domain S-box protein, partial [Acidimicrobiales bacterium]